MPNISLSLAYDVSCRLDTEINVENLDESTIAEAAREYIECQAHAFEPDYSFFFNQRAIGVSDMDGSGVLMDELPLTKPGIGDKSEALVQLLAGMKYDMEPRSEGNEFVMDPDDAVEALGRLIREARKIVNEIEEDPKISAKAYSDDHVVEVEFNAAPFFSNLLFNDDLKASIAALDGCDYGGDYPADVVAEYFSDSDTEEVFSYGATIRKSGRDMGFECHVDKADLKRWLRVNAPELIEMVSE